MNHAILAPSSAQHWRWCAGSVSLSSGIGDEDTDESRDGDTAHWVCEQILWSYIKHDEMLVKIEEDFVDRPAPNGVIVTEDIYDAAYTYAMDILKTCSSNGLMSHLQIEDKLYMPEIHEQCWGTADCWAYDPHNKILYLWDFKYGHSSVIAFENWQMICYLLGALNKLFPGTALQDRGITCKVQITQPRCYDGQGPFRTWELLATDLRGYITQLSQAADAAMLGGYCVTGPWCKNCDGAVHCKAITNAVANIIDHASDAVPVAPTDVGLAYELDLITRAKGLLKQRGNALEQEAEHRIPNGHPVPGYQMVQGMGDRSWDQPYDDVISMGEMMGVDLRGPPKLLTPPKAEQACTKSNVDPSVISSYYSRKPTKMQLKKHDDTKAKQIFSKQRI